MTHSLQLVLLITVAILSPLGVQAQESLVPELRYGPTNSGPVPIPTSERGLTTVLAEPWFKVSDQGLQLEGPSFDRENNLIFLEVFGGRVFKLTPDMTLSTIVPPNKLAPAGIAIHKDGRLFVAGLGNFKDTGSVIAMRPDGSERETIIPASAGYLVDDLVFDSNGGFYFTDFRGSTSEPTGGVYYVSPDFKMITPILKNMAVANGISLSPNGKELWATELSRGLLHRVELENATTIAPYGTAVPYHFTGPAPDSMRADSDGNLYVAMYMQGRVLVFNRSGIPIGQILIPGRDKGHNLRTTSLAIRPGTNDLYIVTNDAAGGHGSTIFHAKSFAKALPLYSHQ